MGGIKYHCWRLPQHTLWISSTTFTQVHIRLVVLTLLYCGARGAREDWVELGLSGSAKPHLILYQVRSDGVGGARQN